MSQGNSYPLLSQLVWSFIQFFFFYLECNDCLKSIVAQYTAYQFSFVFEHQSYFCILSKRKTFKVE